MELTTNTIVMLAVGALVAIWLLVRGVRDLRGTLWIIGAMIFVSAIASQSGTSGTVAWANQTWIQPLQLQRGPLYIAFTCMLVVASLAHTDKLGIRAVPPQALLFGTIGVFAGLLDMLNASPQAGIERLIMTFLAFPTLLVVNMALLKDWEDWYRTLRMLGMVGVVWVAATIVQVFIDPNQLVQGQRRFSGLLGNPQGTAVYMGPQVMFLAFLAVNESKGLLKWVWIATTGVMLVFVAWSGSRTGLGLSVIALTAVFYTRLGRGIFLLPILALALFGLIELAELMNIELPLDRLVSSKDTRTEAWLVLLEDAVNAPLLGGGGGTAKAVENSYLLGAVVYGPIMFLLIMTMMFVNMWQAANLWRVRGRVPALMQRVIDVIIAYYALFYLGAFFEWYILARLDANIPFMIIMSTMGTAIMYKLRHESAAREMAGGGGVTGGGWDHYGVPAEEYENYGVTE